MAIPVQPVPILLSECVEQGLIPLDGSQTVLLSGFGGGLTWGTLILIQFVKSCGEHCFIKKIYFLKESYHGSI